jgi:hypothetical protein
MKRLILLIIPVVFCLGMWSSAGAQIRYSDEDTMTVVDAYGYPGDTIGVVLHMANHTLDVVGYLHRIVYDEEILEPLMVNDTLMSVECLDRGCQLEATEASALELGVVRILAVSWENNYIPVGSGPVAQLNFIVKPTAPPGTITTLIFEDVIPPQENNWSDLSYNLVVPQMVPGNFSILGGGFNQPPVISYIGDREVAEGQLLEFGVTAHDPDGDPITLSAQGLPPNADFPQAQGDSLVTGQFTFQPDYDQGPDTILVTFSAADDHNNVTTQQVRIVVLDQPNDYLWVSTDQGGVPGAAGRPVDVILFNTSPVYGLEFDLLYDVEQIDVPDVQSTERCYDMWFSYNEPDPGRLVILIFSAGLDSISADNGALAQLMVDANPFADIGPTSMILQDAIEVIDSAGTSRSLVTEDGYFTIDQYGDANLDGLVNVGDCVTMVAYIIGRGVLSERQFDAADMNGDDRVDIGDLQQVINTILEIDVPPLSYPTDIPVVVEIGRDVDLSGSQLAVPLWAEIPIEASAVQFEIEFDPERLTAIDISPQDMISHMALDYSVSEGRVRGIVYDLGGASFGPATGDLLNFNFLVEGSGDDVSDGIILEEFLIVNPAADFMPVDIRGRLPESFRLAQNYPNPFNAGTSIRFDLPSAGSVELSVYDLLGRKISVLLDDFLPAGSHQVRWDGSAGDGEPLATGVYFYRLKADGFDETKKMLLMK